MSRTPVLRLRGHDAPAGLNSDRDGYRVHHSACQGHARSRDNVGVRSIGRLMRWAAGFALRLVLAFALGISPALIGLLAGHYVQRLYP